MRLRLDETLRLVHTPGLTGHLGALQLAREAKTQELVNQGKKGKKKKRRRGAKAKRLTEGFGTGIRAPPSGCHPLLQTWRDNCSVWVSRLFAFACPNHQAIAALQELGPLVEIGAGWSLDSTLSNSSCSLFESDFPGYEYRVPYSLGYE